VDNQLIKYPSITTTNGMRVFSDDDDHSLPRVGKSQLESRWEITIFDPQCIH